MWRTKTGLQCRWTDIWLFYIRGFGLCLSFTGFSFNPWTEQSLTWSKGYLPLFSHTSLDPLGAIRVNFDESTFTKLVYPLVLVDINLSITDVVLMMGLSSKDVYLALMLVQDKYKTQIIQHTKLGNRTNTGRILVLETKERPWVRKSTFACIALWRNWDSG